MRNKSKPQTVELRTDHPLASGLRDTLPIVEKSIRPRWVKTGTVIVPEETTVVSVVSSEFGPAIKGNGGGSTGDRWTWNVAGSRSSARKTTAVLLRDTGGTRSGYDMVISLRNGSNFEFILATSAAPNSLTGTRINSGSEYDIASPIPIGDGWAWWVWSVDPSGWRLHRVDMNDETDVQTLSYSVTPPTVMPETTSDGTWCLLGDITLGPLNNYPAEVAAVYHWDARALTAAEAVSLREDPWGLIRPRRVYSYRGAPTPPTYTGTMAVTAAAAEVAITGTASPPVYAGTVELVAAPAVVAIEGTHTPPVYAGLIAVAGAAAEVVLVGTHTPPVYAGEVQVSAAAATVAVVGTFVPYVGTVAVTSAAAQVAMTGTFSGPVRTSRVAAVGVRLARRTQLTAGPSSRVTPSVRPTRRIEVRR